MSPPVDIKFSEGFPHQNLDTRKSIQNLTMKFS